MEWLKLIGGREMSNIMKKINKQKSKEISISDAQMKQVNEHLAIHGGITSMATSYIQRWINKKFNPIYWAENNHGKMEYEEMAILILTLFKSEMKMFLPLIFEDECYMTAYNTIEKSLERKELKKINYTFIEEYNIDLNVVRKDVVLTLNNYFKASKEKMEGEKNVA